MKFATIILLAAMMTGCVSNVSKYDAFIEASLDAKTGAYEAPAQRLLTNASAYVTMATDGRYGSKTYPNSGYFLSSATTAAISLHLTRIEQAARVETIEESLSSAGQMGLTYVFQPTILHWEGRSTGWSGKPDRITIKVVVWSVETGKDISSTVLRASGGKWGTFGDHPQDLLPGVITPFVNKLFNG